MALMVAVTAFIVGDKVWVREFGFLSGMLNLIVLFMNNTFGAILASFISLLVVLFLSLIKLPKRPDHRHSAGGGVLLNAQFDNFIVVLLQDIGKIMSEVPMRHRPEPIGGVSGSKPCSTFQEHPLLGYGCEGMADRMMNDIGIPIPTTSC